MPPKPASKPEPRIKYSNQLADRLCAEVAVGKSLRTIAKLSWAPSTTHFFTWIGQHSYFAEQYARAKAQAQDAMLEKMFDVAEDATPENVHVARLKIDTMKWAASKLAPKKYGDKSTVDVNHGFGNVDDEELKSLLRQSFATLGVTVPPHLLPALGKSDGQDTDD